MRIRHNNGQNILEYTMLILICAAALIAMTTYVQRAMNARLKQAQDELNYYRAE
jgi:Flp pilus assembly pilin Flp